MFVQMFAESENRYEALARKLNTQETEGVKSNERAENVEVCNTDLGESYNCWLFRTSLSTLRTS